MSGKVKVFWHEHLLDERVGDSSERCDACQELILKSTHPNRLYGCFICDIKCHTSCVPSSPGNINHPCHPNHPLELLLQGPPNYSVGHCNLCLHDLFTFLYHCKLCDFSIDVICARNPQPLTVDHPKCHQHPLTIMGRDVSFICNACGMPGERNPYVCLPCSHMFHYDCIDLPHVININRHDHRISHAYPLSPADRICEFCRQDINWRYGAYSCNKCTDFFVHSRCATRKDVWDGIELEGIPDEEVDTSPFKVIDEGVINHFSHDEHNLLLIEEVIIDGGGEAIHCEACSHPISFERYYNCFECDFMLHEKCANLPLQKRHGLSTRILFLSTVQEKEDTFFSCVACDRVGTGFRYSDGEGIVLDVLCASLSWFRHRKLHPHTLFLTTLDHGTCIGCEGEETYVLGCVECQYSLDFKCATLPVVIKHRCDDHFLLLNSGEKAAGKYWCEICEAETNPENWFYTCYDCGVVCHVDCVIGDSLNIKPGLTCVDDVEIEVVLNDQNSRPLCTSCGSRCSFPKFYKYSSSTLEGVYCSLLCMANRLYS